MVRHRERARLTSRKACESWLSSMGSARPVRVDEEMAHPTRHVHRDSSGGLKHGFRLELTVILFAILVFAGCAISPPSLMDDVDAVQAQIARNMLSGDWVTAR